MGHRSSLPEDHSLCLASGPIQALCKAQAAMQKAVRHGTLSKLASYVTPCYDCKSELWTALNHRGEASSIQAQLSICTAASACTAYL